MVPPELTPGLVNRHLADGYYDASQEKHSIQPHREATEGNSKGLLHDSNKMREHEDDVPNDRVCDPDSG